MKNFFIMMMFVVGVTFPDFIHHSDTSMWVWFVTGLVLGFPIYYLLEGRK